MNRTHLTLALLAAVAAAMPATAPAQRHSEQLDLYGYSQFTSDTPNFCRFDYVALPSAASPLTLVRGQAGAAADDKGAVVPLLEPFDFYGIPTDSVIVSGNGYLAMGDSFEQDDASDFSNDCPLPALGDNPSAGTERIFVYHDDLRVRAGAQVREAHFDTCPRPSETGATEACTVIEWTNFERVAPAASATPLRMQVVLYHGTHEIVTQYLTLDDTQGASATFGIQGLEASSAKLAGCDTAARVRPRMAMCYFDRRYGRNSVDAGTVVP